MTKNILIFLGLGTAIGLMFVVGRLTAPDPVVLKEPTPTQKVDKLKAVQEQLKYSYYSELLRKPANEVHEAPEESPEPITKVAEPTAPAPITSDNKSSPDRMAKALANVLGNETPTSVQTAIKDALPAGTGSKYAIQVASLPDRVKAEAMVLGLKQKGHQARLVQANLPGKGSVFRVRIHGFESREAADKYREDKQLEGITVAQ